MRGWDINDIEVEFAEHKQHPDSPTGALQHMKEVVGEDGQLKQVPDGPMLEAFGLAQLAKWRVS